jgi:thiamine-phosphate pyrophosphorylase
MPAGRPNGACPSGRPLPVGPPRIYPIADLDLLGPRLPAAVVAMANAGARWIQLRAKRATGAELHDLAARCCEALVGSDTLLWLDDRVDLAAILPVGGVHLGQSDLAPGEARAILGPQVAIGVSTHDLTQLVRAAGDAAVDVVAVGPVFPTRSKVNPDPVVGLGFVREARRLTGKPLVAIGGIDETNLASVLSAGADAVAVLSAVCRGDVEQRCRALFAAAAA